MIPALKITDFPFTLLYCTISRALYLAFSHPAPLQTSLCVFLKGTLALVSDPILKTFPMFHLSGVHSKLPLRECLGRGAAVTTETCPRTVSLKNKSLTLRHGSQKWYLNVLLDSHGNRGKRREKPLYLWGRGMCAPWAQQPAAGGAGDFVHLLFSPSPTRTRDTGPAWN